MRWTPGKIALLTVLVLLIAVVFFPYNSYAPDLLAAIKQSARAHGFNADVKDLKIAFPGGVKASNLNALVPFEGFTLPLQFESVELIPQFLPLLRFRGSWESLLRGYGGEINISSHYSFWGKLLDVSLKASGLRLSQHPVLGSAGFDGVLQLEGAGQWLNLWGQASLPKTASLKGTLENGDATLSQILAGQLVLPHIENIAADFNLSYSDERLSLERFNLTSSMGKATGHGSLIVDEIGRIKRGKFYFDIRLNDEGRIPLGGWFAQWAGESVEDPNYNYKVDIEMQGNRAQYTIRGM